ncbi:MAG: hypothetical protein JSR54_02185 [Proteobacteria bacterium]|nr:hypothetical protein [Pseudomonadota bacterium]
MAARPLPADPRDVPRAAVVGAGLLILATLALAAFARRTDVGVTRYADLPAVASLDITVADRADGAVVVARAADARTLGVLAPGTNGFLRAALRGLVHERHREGVGAAPPFTLTRYADGRLVLIDQGTQRRIELDAFGPDNARVFARLLVAGAAPVQETAP